MTIEAWIMSGSWTQSTTARRREGPATPGRGSGRLESSSAAPSDPRPGGDSIGARLDHNVTAVVGPVAIALGVMYLTSVVHRALDPTLAATTAPTAIVPTLAFLTVGFLALWRPVPTALAHPVIVVTLGMLTIESLGRGAAVASPNLQLALIGAGAVMVRPRWLVGGVAAVVVPWALVVILAPWSSWGQASSAYALDLVTATLLGVTVFIGRRRALVALELARTEAHEAAMRDDLTGLLNRRGLDLAGNTILDHARRMGEPVAVLMVDLAGFKAINDALGHAEGDRALATTAGLMRATLRKSDIIGRIGGDEFVIITGPQSDRATLVDRVECALRDWRDEDDRYRLEPTIGMVVVGPEDRRPLWQLVDEADRLMYAQRGALGLDDAGAQGPRRLRERQLAAS
jgi:diguanylate cyclase (GGDEF)-like protein